MRACSVRLCLFRFLLAASAVLATGPANLARADAITGRASTIDGDTLEIRGTRIRLFGIDAPEGGQTCHDATGARYRCGQKAADILADRIGRTPVSCEVQDRDPYDRPVAICRQRGEDLGGWMVREGWALAFREYSDRYVDAEGQARRRKTGLWSGSFVRPWIWRRDPRR